MTLAEIDLPHIVSAELICIIEDTIANQPRTLQRAIGPSEIGVPCTRRLIHRLVEHDDPPSRRGPAWLAYIGSCVHAGLELGVRQHPTNQAVAQPRYLTEQRVMVGTAGGRAIWGSSDLFDIDSGTVVDWKVVGPKRIDHYAVHGPGQQYRTQAHLYGRGFAAQGYTVNHVMIMFLPRDGELKHHYAWAEPYDETIALEGLSRIDDLVAMIDALGVDVVLDLFPPCDDYFCPWCRQRTTTRERSTTTAELFGERKALQ